MKMPQIISITGPLPRELANAVSSAIHFALQRGMAIDEACCVVAGIAADYARVEYGDEYLDNLAAVIKAHAGRPLPRGAKGKK